MKRQLHLLMIIYLLSVGSIFAQSIQVLMSPKPSPYISDWQQKTETLKLIISNTTANTIVVKIKSELLDGSNTLIAATDASKMHELEVPPGVTTYDASDVFPLTAVNYKGKAQTTTAQTGRIPDDNYQLCVALTDPKTNVVVGTSGTVCKSFSITDFQAPTLMNPINNLEIAETGVKGIVFRWTPIIPKPRDPVIYRLQVWEVLEGQTSMIALRSNQPIVEKDCKEILQTQWPIDNALPEAGKKYVWTITPLDGEGRKLVDGNGFSEPFGFSISNKSIVSKVRPLEDTTKKIDDGDGSGGGGGSGLRTSSGVTGPDTLGTVAVGDEILAGEDGEFIVKVSEITTNSDGSFNGKGRVRINWIKAYLGVEFKRIRVGADKRLTKGVIVSSRNNKQTPDIAALPQAWGMGLLTGTGIQNGIDYMVDRTNTGIKDVYTWLDSLHKDTVRFKYAPEIDAPEIPVYSLKVPFGLYWNETPSSTIATSGYSVTLPKLSPFTLAITEMVFKPNESKINFVNKQEFYYEGNTHQMGFAGKNFFIHQNKIEFEEGRIELVENFLCPSILDDPKMKFTFKKGATDGTGTFIEWCDTGLKRLGIELETSFSREWLIPMDEDGNELDSTHFSKAIITGNGRSMNDILLTGSLSNSLIGCVKGVGIMADSIALDLSLERNLSSIQFPDNYEGITDETWKGFHIKTLAVTLPDKWKTSGATGKVQFVAENVIIDNQGITSDIKAFNILALNSSKIANFGASIDTVAISIVAGSLVSGNASGMIILPVSEVKQENTLRYKVSFAQEEIGNVFQVAILPYQDIEANILKGKMTLNETSNILLTFTPNAFNADLCLNGSFHWDNPNLASSSSSSTVGDLSVRSSGAVGVKIDIEFEEIKLLYTHIKSADINTMTFDLGNWSFASPQKRFANMPITIKGIRYKSMTTGTSSIITEKELIRGAIIFDVVINLSKDIGGTCAFGPVFSLAFDKSSIEFKPHFIGFNVDSCKVKCDLPAVKLSGSLVMYDNDPKFGNGFLATLSVGFKAYELKVNALVQFGNTTYNNAGNHYRYWRVESDCKFKPGMPFISGLSFFGFGGGAYFNMTALPIASIANPGSTAFTFEPKVSTWGFQVMATIGTTKVETFNCDVSLLAEFNTSGGINKIAFLGNFWVAAELSKRPTAMIKGTLALDYTIPTKVFNLVAGVTINVYPTEQIITTPTPIGLILHIDGKNNKWYFTCGTPNAVNTVNVFGVRSYSYFMFGNDLKPEWIPNGFTNGFKSRYSAILGGEPSFNGDPKAGVGPNTASGKGFAAGLGFYFDKNVDQSLFSGTCRNWSAYANCNIGAEIDLAYLQYNACGSRSTWGINEYRMNGALGIYANISAGIKGINYSTYACPSIKDPNRRCNTCSDKYYSLFDLKCGAWVTGEFPKPVYAEGEVKGDISAFDDLISCNFNQSFTYGERCGSGVVVDDPNPPKEDKANNYKNKLIQFAGPNTRYNYNVKKPFNVGYSLVPNQVFDIAENQGDGTIKSRTFKMVNTYKLEMQDSITLVWSIKPISQKLNITGEYLYFITPQTTSGYSGSASYTGMFQPTLTSSSNSFSSYTVSLPSSLDLSAFAVVGVPSSIPAPLPPNYPNPDPQPENSLVKNREYKFTTTATLMEYINGAWVVAKTSSGSNITETKVIFIRTGAQPPITNNSSTSTIHIGR